MSKNLKHIKNKGLTNQTLVKKIFDLVDRVNGDDWYIEDAVDKCFWTCEELRTKEKEQELKVFFSKAVQTTKEYLNRVDLLGDLKSGKVTEKQRAELQHAAQVKSYDNVQRIRYILGTLKKIYEPKNGTKNF